MIVYSATRAAFTADVYANAIEAKVLAAFNERLGQSTSRREVESWKHSMQYVNNVLVSSEIPDDAGVAIEYRIPLTSKRVDFILTGLDADEVETAVIIELKQWSTVEATEKDAIVMTAIGGASRETVHPSYQAWTYAALIRDFNEAVRDDSIALRPCAYLHNCESAEAVGSSVYDAHTKRAPVFVRPEVERLGEFLRRYVRYGDRSRILYRIDEGRLKPSKGLVDHLLSLLKGNREFELVDDQKLAYEAVLERVEKARTGPKQVVIVEGGPGTGKSVLAVNLLVECTRRELLAHYVTRNAAPRDVYQSKLTGTFTKTHVSNLFKGSGAYTQAPADGMDALIVDEAHRLNEKSGLFRNLGENQIKEIVNAARLSVFFVDEDQRVTLNDIGEKAGIRRWAESLGAEVHEMSLASQFRCNGSEGYLAWVDNALQIVETANETLEDIDYDFRVCDDPNELYALIVDRNASANRARLVAGYCWDWKGKKDPRIRDVVIPEHDFAMRWNLDSDGFLWILQSHSVEEIGCIHTCQGLELDYVGVIIGPDLVVRDGQIVTDAAKRSSQDHSIRGYKKMLKQDPERARSLADRIIRNTYRTLLTRGQKGCYVFCVDEETNEYFRQLARAGSLAGRGEAGYAKVAEEAGGYRTDEEEG